jgi:glycosyltransferase involved in cell wall biosynthesis
MSLDVTVYVPCFNVAEYLPQVLAGLKRQTYAIREIIAIDDGSTDDSAAVAERLGARVIRHSKNLGLAAARNTAVRETRTEWIGSVDGDVVAEPNWLAHLARVARDGNFSGVCGQLRETQFLSAADYWRNVHMRQWWGEEFIANPKFLFGNNTLYRRQALLDAGLYDEKCRTNGEDADMGARITAGGGRLAYEPEARCDHLRRDSLASLYRTYWRYHWWETFPQTFRGFRERRRIGRRILRQLLHEDLASKRYRELAVTLGMRAAWFWYDWRLLLTGQRP